MKNWKNLGIILIFLNFFLLRLYHLGYHDLWFDEAGTVSYAQYPWGNWNAPFYWILLHFWIKIFGISEFSLRFPSLLFNFLSIILIFLLGKDIFGKKIAIIASLFLGLSPFHLWYAQEARDYSMVLFFGLLSSWLLYRALRQEKFKLWLYFTLVSIAGFYTNYFYIFLFLTHLLCLIFFKKMRLDFKEIIWFLIAALGSCLYLPRFLSKFYYVWQGFWIPTPNWKFLLITLENFLLGYNGSPFLYLIVDILLAGFLISISWMVYKRKELRKGFAFCLFLFFIPIICVFFFSKLFFSVYLDRALIIFSPYFYLILSLGAASLKRITNAALLSILILLILIADYRYFKDWMVRPFEHHTGACIKKPFKPAAKFLDTNIGPQDIISFTNECIIPSLEFYSQRKPYPYYYFFDPEFPDSNWKRPIQQSEFYIPYFKINNLIFKRLWVISSDWERSGKLDENSQSIKEWCGKNLKLNFTQELDGLWIFGYVKE